MDKLPKPGDRVRVPFGQGYVEAEVIDASDFGIGGIVEVRVFLDGLGTTIDDPNPFITAFRVERVEPLEAALPSSGDEPFPRSQHTRRRQRSA